MDYLVASTPRSGSNLLCSLLQATGVLGTPSEYLCPTQIAEHGPRLCGFASVEEAPHRFPIYYEACRRAFATAGRFGVKAHFDQLEHAVARGFDLARFFPDRIVHLTRADLVGQAISLVRAAQTGAWISSQEERATPRFDAHAIRAAVRKLVVENQAWETVFRECDVEPYRLSYERLCADFDGELHAVMRFLDVDAEDVDGAVAHVLAHFETQRDARSDEWRARYAEWIRQRAARARRSTDVEHEPRP